MNFSRLLFLALGLSLCNISQVLCMTKPARLTTFKAYIKIDNRWVLVTVNADLITPTKAQANARPGNAIFRTSSGLVFAQTDIFAPDGCQYLRLVTAKVPDSCPLIPIELTYA